MIVFPQDSMKSDLERLWRTCFGDSQDYIRYFFENRYVPENCLVFVDESVRRPVAMLHLLNVGIAEDGAVVPSQYIYAACTRPDYRRQGIMRQLIETAQKLGQSRRLKYSVTVSLTADPSLNLCSICVTPFPYVLVPITVPALLSCSAAVNISEALAVFPFTSTTMSRSSELAFELYTVSDPSFVFSLIILQAGSR